MDFSRKTNKILILTLILSLGFLFLFVLGSCAPLDDEWVINNLFPNLWVFLSHLLSAGVLISVMVWLVWKPAKKTLTKRHDYIAHEIEEAEKAKKAATIELTEANQMKVDALTKAMDITTKAKVEAAGIVEKAKALAQQEASQLKLKAQDDIAKEKENIRAEAQDNIINIAFDVAGSILQKEVSKQDKDKYIDELLDSISKDLKKSK